MLMSILRHPVFTISGWVVVLASGVAIAGGGSDAPGPEVEGLRQDLADTQRQLQAAKDLATDRALEITGLESQLEEIASQAEPEPEPPPSPEPSEAPRATGPEVVAEFSGTGIESTRPFTVDDDWEVRWTAEGDLFQLYLNDRDGNFVDILANQLNCPCRGKSFQAQGGSYYFEPNAIGTWSLEVIQV